LAPPGATLAALPRHGIATRRFAPRCSATTLRGTTAMLTWTIIFLVVALIAGVLGFGGIASTASGIAKVLFFVFLVLFAISLISGQGFGV
jgi:uncharacterized membrane protein YtjA (UPF0391 family)